MSDPKHDSPKPKTVGELPDDRPLPKETTPSPTSTEQIFEPDPQESPTNDRE